MFYCVLKTSGFRIHVSNFARKKLRLRNFSLFNKIHQLKIFKPAEYFKNKFKIFQTFHQTILGVLFISHKTEFVSARIVLLSTRKVSNENVQSIQMVCRIEIYPGIR